MEVVLPKRPWCYPTDPQKTWEYYEILKYGNDYFIDSYKS